MYKVTVHIISINDNDTVNLPLPKDVEKIIEKIKIIIPIPKRNVKEKLLLEFRDGLNSDTYELPYPNNLFYARRVRKVLEKIGIPVICEDYWIEIQNE